MAGMQHPFQWRISAQVKLVLMGCMKEMLMLEHAVVNVSVVVQVVRQMLSGLAHIHAQASL